MRLLLAAVLCLGVVAATGCGGGSERLSATEYRTQLDQLGERANARLAIAQHRFAAAFLDILPTLEASRTVEAARSKLRRGEEFAVAGQEVDHAISVLKKLGYMSNAEEEEK